MIFTIISNIKDLETKLNKYDFRFRATEQYVIKTNRMPSRVHQEYKLLYHKGTLGHRKQLKFDHSFDY